MTRREDEGSKSSSRERSISQSPSIKQAKQAVDELDLMFPTITTLLSTLYLSSSPSNNHQSTFTLTLASNSNKLLLHSCHLPKSPSSPCDFSLLPGASHSINRSHRVHSSRAYQTEEQSSSKPHGPRENRRRLNCQSAVKEVKEARRPAQNGNPPRPFLHIAPAPAGWMACTGRLTSAHRGDFSPAYTVRYVLQCDRFDASGRKRSCRLQCSVRRRQTPNQQQGSFTDSLGFPFQSTRF